MCLYSVVAAISPELICLANSVIISDGIQRILIENWKYLAEAQRFIRS